jgi:hypothetical protein
VKCLTNIGAIEMKIAHKEGREARSHKNSFAEIAHGGSPLRNREDKFVLKNFRRRALAGLFVLLSYWARAMTLRPTPNAITPKVWDTILPGGADPSVAESNFRRSATLHLAKGLTAPRALRQWPPFYCVGQ